jgi:23S rRNA pseudouridine1911/1915/1917 synthase
VSGGHSIIQARIADDAQEWRLDRALAAAVPTLSRERLKALICSGAVEGPAGLVRDPAVKAIAGGTYAVSVPAPRPAHNEAQDIALEIPFEDEHLLVVDKPAGMVVHPAAGNADGTLVNALLHHCAGRLSGIGGVARPGIVHRIDKDTSGLLVVAKDDVTLNALAAEFKAHTVERVYDALGAGKPPAASGRIDTLYGRDPRERKKFSSRVRTGKRAVTNWRVLERFPGAARIEARLETGRTHQLRVHMAALGCPLLGDRTYGRPPREPALRAIAEALGRQALHARVLGFVHPGTGARLSFTSALPPDMQVALEALRALGEG